VSHQSLTPHDIPPLSLNALVERWSAARSRTFLARHQSREADPRDLFAELAYGVRIAEEATASRWCVIADLLRLGAVDSWYQAADALGITETEARDGFHGWIAGQVDLRHRTGSIGLAEDETAELYALSEAVAWYRSDQLGPDERSDTSEPARCIGQSTQLLSLGRDPAESIGPCSRPRRESRIVLGEGAGDHATIDQVAGERQHC
jgi:hypothetical protein